MVFALKIVGFCGLTSANANWVHDPNAQGQVLTHSQGHVPGGPKPVASLPYTKGPALFHDNFSPYDYNYYHERRHRAIFHKDSAERQKMLEWEGIEKINANWAGEYKKLSGGSVSSGDAADANAARKKLTVTYESPLAYPESHHPMDAHGLKITPPTDESPATSPGPVYGTAHGPGYGTAYGPGYGAAYGPGYGVQYGPGAEPAAGLAYGPGPGYAGYGPPGMAPPFMMAPPQVMTAPPGVQIR